MKYLKKFVDLEAINGKEVYLPCAISCNNKFLVVPKTENKIKVKLFSLNGNFFVDEEMNVYDSEVERVIREYYEIDSDVKIMKSNIASKPSKNEMFSKNNNKLVLVELVLL